MRWVLFIGADLTLGNRALATKVWRQLTAHIIYRYVRITVNLALISNDIVCTSHYFQ